MPDSALTADRTKEQISTQIQAAVDATNDFFTYMDRQGDTLTNIDDGEEAGQALRDFTTARYEFRQSEASKQDPAKRKALVEAAARLSNHLDGSKQVALQGQLQALGKAQRSLGSAVSDISGMVGAEANRIETGDLTEHQSKIASFYAGSQDESKSPMDRAMLLSQLTMLKCQ